MKKPCPIKAICPRCDYPAGDAPRCSECGSALVIIDQTIADHLRATAAKRRPALFWRAILAANVVLVFAVPIAASALTPSRMIDDDAASIGMAWGMISALAVVVPVALTRSPGRWRLRNAPIEALASLLLAASTCIFARSYGSNTEWAPLWYACPIFCPGALTFGALWPLADMPRLRRLPLSALWRAAALIGLLLTGYVAGLIIVLIMFAMHFVPIMAAIALIALVATIAFWRMSPRIRTLAAIGDRLEAAGAWH